ncbi:MAG: glycine cleavage system protein R [Candidatus Competibacteraceae bacterium]|nr:glycine cleavage system protein R [Candidatus Competibacteraceae bacterium]
MMTSIVLTVIGQDKPGLVKAVSQKIVSGGGNWLDSRMASLAGQFAGLLLVSVPRTKADALIASLQSLERDGLRLMIERGAETAPAAGRTLKLDLTGHDRPGIVRDISDVLARRQVNIEEMETAFFSGSFSGEDLFEMRATLRAPAELTDFALREAFESLASDLMVDITLA